VTNLVGREVIFPVEERVRRGKDGRPVSDAASGAQAIAAK
jgi:hypothetical protein